MPLFICDHCDTIENTACGDHIGNLLDATKPKLCSVCMSSAPPYRKGGVWHGHFERRRATPALKAALEASKKARFNEMPEGMQFPDMPLWHEIAP